MSVIDQKLRFAHFKLLGVSQIYKEFGLESGNLLKILESAYVDAQFKIARKHRKGGIEKFSNALLGSRKMPNHLKGNFAFLIYIRERNFVWGGSRVGASTIAKKWLQEQCKTNLVPIDASDISEMFAALPGAENHSEYLLLNALGNFIQSSGQNITSSDVDGHVALFTELSPCQSCTSVIDKFLSRYPKISIFVAYALEHHYDPKILKNILKARGGSALKQFNASAATGKMHWERID